MYREWAERMNNAETAEERATVVGEIQEHLGVSKAKAYKELKAAGWASGRKQRKDAGTTGINEEQLNMVAAMIRQSLRKNGKATMPIDVARSILLANGYDIPIGNSRLRELLRDRHIAITDAKSRTPHQRMRSEYPNQIHQVDPSVCLLYFAPSGRQKIIGDDEQYKNKNFLEGKLKCWRYVLTDHCSGSICVRYYAAKGESAINMYHFLLYAWGQKHDPLYAFHGLPETLIWDCGSANTAKAVTNALTALRVVTLPHMPGNSRAKGQVENGNNLVETQFESRLRFEPVHSIEELNAAAERWCAGYNANMILGQDTRLTREGERIGARLMLWQRIKPEQLLELPDPEICRQIYSEGIQNRRVAGDLTISIAHPMAKRSLRYSIAHLPGIYIRQSVNVQPILVAKDPLVRISYEFEKKPVSFEVEPIAYDEMGFDVDAPVFGKEYKRQPDTIREQNAKELAALAGNKIVPFADLTDGNGLKAHSFINASSPFITQRTGEQITVSQPDSVEIHDILISHFEALRRVSSRIGYAPEGFIDEMKKEFPEGVPSSLIDDIAKEFEARPDAAAL